MIYLLRVGPFGQIGRFRSPFQFRPLYGDRVICRTDKGLEVAEFVDCFDDSQSESIESIDGELIRTMSQQDHLLADRLNRNKLEAIDQCQKLIDKEGLPVSILDADLTFDGRGLFFFFMGEVDQRLDSITESLTSTFDAEVRFSEFAETLAQGCGPDCGTKENGCGTSGCASCGLKSSCK